MNTPFVLPGPSLRRIAGLAVAFALLASGAITWGKDPHAAPAKPRSYLLHLDTESKPTAIYFSAWNGGPIVAGHDASDGKSITYRRDFVWSDGCTWQAVERLTPDGDRYVYFYVEHLVACPNGSQAFGVPSPRSGFVTVSPLALDAEPAPLTGTASGWSPARGPTDCEEAELAVDW